MEEKRSMIAAATATEGATKGPPPLLDFIPTYNWIAPYNNPEETLKDLRECGYTASMCYSESIYLPLCERLGLKAIVSVPGIAQNRRAVGEQSVPSMDSLRERFAPIREVAKHPAVIGVLFGDEPHAANMEAMAREYQVFRELAPGKIPYCDVYPINATPQQMGVATYEEYVRKYAEIVKPLILSGVPLFAFMEDGTTDLDRWFEGAEVLAHVARDHKIPLWMFAQSLGFCDHRVPTEADMTFQVYAALAHGAKGIGYFVHGPDHTFGNWRGSPLDGFGDRTPTWYVVRSLNRQVQTLAAVLVRLHSTGVYHWPKAPKGCKALTGEGVIRRPGRQDAGDSRSLLVGEFVHDNGTPYVILVNKNLQKSCPFGDLLRSKFGNTFHRQNQYRKEEEKLALPVGERDWLAPGAGMLLRVEDG